MKLSCIFHRYWIKSLYCTWYWALHSLKTESFYVVLGLISVVLLRTLKTLIKFCKDVFYISALKHFHKPFFHGGHFGVFFGLLYGIYLYFLKTVWVLMKFDVHIIGNKTKKLWRGYCSLLGAILKFCFCGGRGEGANFQYFFLFFEKVLEYFHQILQRSSWNYSGNHTKYNIACCLHFVRLF